jgi:methionine-rich copper-binding protein CopC
VETERERRETESGTKVRRFVFAALYVAQSLACAPVAWAHAFLDHASPPVGSTVRASPPEVKLWFTQELEPAFSTVRVQEDGGGKRVDKDDATVDTGGTLLQVSLPKLEPGRYRVTWRVLSVDTHVTEGDFTFEVVP